MTQEMTCCQDLCRKLGQNQQYDLGLHAAKFPFLLQAHNPWKIEPFQELGKSIPNFTPNLQRTSKANAEDEKVYVRWSYNRSV